MWNLRKSVTDRVLSTDLYASIVLRRRSFLTEMGWFESWRSKRSIDRLGNPVPWITYPALMFLQSRVLSDWCVFEYGSGNSTLWWSKRVAKVVSCEHDIIWHEELSGLVEKNVELHLRPLTDPQSYVDMPHSSTLKYDVMFVDGAEREACLINAPRSLKSNGVIVLDDSDRLEYRSAIDQLCGSGFKVVDFDGPGPIIEIRWRTSIFYRNDNCVNL
jgi:hypothetical protein